MFDDALILLVSLLLILIGFVVVLFIPSLIETVKPSDKGPRVVKDSTLEQFGVKVHRLNGDVLRVKGDLKLPNHFEFKENLVVKGNLAAGDCCHFGESLKVLGNLILGNSVVIGGNLVADGDVNISDEAAIDGSISAGGCVKLGEKVFVRGSVVAGGDVELFENCEVVGGVLSGKQGAVRVLKVPSVELPSAIDDVG